MTRPLLLRIQWISSQASRWALWSLFIGLLLLTSCATPVGVQRVDTQEAHRLLTASALATGTASEPTIQVVTRLDLVAQFASNPVAALTALHSQMQSALNKDQVNNRLFALAELSFLYAERQKQGWRNFDRQCRARKGRPCPPVNDPQAEEQSRAYYLATAVYAYAFLFPEKPQDAVHSIADPRVRLAFDLYNRGLAEGLRSPGGEEVALVSGRYRLPFGELEIQSTATDFSWGGYHFEHFVPTVNFAIRGLRNHYRRPGIGAPLVANLMGVTVAPTVVGANRIPLTLKVPLTTFLRLETPRHSLSTGALRGQLELYAPDQTETVSINNQMQPLEFDATAALAYSLEGSRWYEFELAGFMRSVADTYLPKLAPKDGLLLLDPPQRNRIPIVLVHGTASSPARWAELINEIEGDPWLRDRYQVWLFMYDTGNPIGYSGGRLRQALEHVVDELDPTGTATALRQMVVIGHSQGGLLTKLTTIHSGTRFWDHVSNNPLDKLTMEPETRELLHQSLFFEPLSFVKRVVFISTPHHGSYQAALRLGRLASWLVTLPNDLTQRTLNVIAQNRDKLLIQKMERPPTSIDDMSPSSPFIKTLVTIPVADGIVAHSIIAVQGDGLPITGDDGIVKYESAHIEGVESELVVHFGHSVQSHPQAIEEVRRILLLHGGAPTPQ